MLFASDVYFNSRPSARGDLFLLRICVISNWISIHAPPRGATACTHGEAWRFLFQFTPLREGRHQITAHTSSISDFNSRPSARGDSMSYTTATPTKYFNSRPSARGDRQECRLCGRLTNFNSRPSARGDLPRVDEKGATMRFQFTPLREGRQTGSTPTYSV